MLLVYLSGMCFHRLQDGAALKDKEPGSPAPGRKVKGTKLPVSNLQEGLSGKGSELGSSNGIKGERGSISNAAVSKLPGSTRGSGRSNTASGAMGSTASGLTARPRGDQSPGHATASSMGATGFAATSPGSLAAVGLDGSRGVASRGGRGGGRSSRIGAGFSSRGGGPVSGAMMTPFLTPAGPGGRNGVAPMFYNGNNVFAPNVFYPPAAYGMGLNSAAVASAAASKLQIMESVRKQIDYYFSMDNLCKDIFLRSKMDEKGWIPLAVVANFNRVRMLTPDMMLIVEAMRDSPIVEVAKDSAYLRARETWESWILPLQQRDLSHNPVSPKQSDVALESGVDGQRDAQQVASANKPALSHVESSKPSPAKPVPMVSPSQAAAKDEEDEEEDLFEMDEVGQQNNG